MNTFAVIAKKPEKYDKRRNTIRRTKNVSCYS